MKVLLFANTDWYLYNFRLPLGRALRAAGAEVVFVSPSGQYGAKLEKNGFRWIPLPMERRSLNPLREVLLLLRLYRLYQAERPDLVHHFTIKCVIYGSLAARLAGIERRINAVAGMGYVFTATDVRARLLRPLVRLLMRVAMSGNQSRLILQNRDDCAAFAKFRLADPQKVRLIRGSGVNTRQFRPHKCVAKDGTFRVILAARLLWEKGIQEYVDAAKRLRSTGMAVEFLLAGAPDPGNPASVPMATIRQWKQLGVVRVLGHVDDVRYWLRQCHLAVLPSYYGEGVPKSLIEAAACGLPLVATDSPGCREIVEHGVNGLLVPSRDAIALSNAIKYMIENPTERIRMGEAGRRKVVKDFDERVVLRRTIDVYRELGPGAFADPPKSERYESAVTHTGESPDIVSI